MSDHASSHRNTRTPLQNVRDVALTIMAVLLSIVSAIVLYVMITAGSTLYRIDDRIDAPVPPAPSTSLPE